MYNYIVFIFYIIYIFSFIKIYNINSNYIQIINDVYIYFISFFLFFRFNPLNKIKITNFDKKIVFDAALFLIITHTFFSIVKLYLLNKVETINKSI